MWHNSVSKINCQQSRKLKNLLNSLNIKSHHFGKDWWWHFRKMANITFNSAEHCSEVRTCMKIKVNCIVSNKMISNKSVIKSNKRNKILINENNLSEFVMMLFVSIWFYLPMVMPLILKHGEGRLSAVSSSASMVDLNSDAW